MKTILKFWGKGYLYLFIAAILLFVFLIDPHVGIYDWGKEIAYFDYIKVSMTQYGSLPLFWWNPQDLFGYPAISQSAFFLANPETFVFSPLIVFLYLFDTLFFMKLLACLFCAVGVMGIFFLRKRLQWEDIQFRSYIALFLFSPIIIQHVAIGYFPWLNLFLFPWLIYFLMDEDLINSVLGTASVLALTLLQGGAHPFVWYAIFFGLFCIVHLILKPGIRLVIVPILVVGLALLLSWVRIATSAQTFGDFQQTFFNGYSLKGFLSWGLTPPVFTPASMDDIEPYIESYNNGVPYWDGATFWGIVIPLTVVFFIGMVLSQISFKDIKYDRSRLVILGIAIASLLVTLLSFGNLYQTLITSIANLLKSPALEAIEKYPFRFAIIGYFGFSIVISHYIEILISLIQQPIKALLSFLLKQKEEIKRSPKPNFLKWLKVILIILTVLWISSYLLHTAIFTWLEPAVQSAYLGEGYAWLTSLMSQRNSLPLAAYLQKASLLYNLIQTAIRVVLLFGWAAYLISCFSSQIAAIFHRQLQFIHDHLGCLLEVLMVVPLLLASVMWLRVALATPTSSFSRITILSPQTEVQPPSAEAEIFATPAQLTIDAANPNSIDKIIFSQIRYEDRRFLLINTNEAEWVNSNSRLALIARGNSPIVISVNPGAYLPALWITLTAWLAVIVLVIFRSSRKLHYK